VASRAEPIQQQGTPKAQQIASQQAFTALATAGLIDASALPAPKTIVIAAIVMEARLRLVIEFLHWRRDRQIARP
jgi:hypothetical protein